LPEQNLPELKRRLAAGKLGVQAVIPDNEQRPEQGDLTFVDNLVDRTTGTIKLKGTFANRERRLWPGQFVKAVLKLGDQDAVVVPSDAVQTGQKGQQVFVVRGESEVEVRPVVVGRSLNGESVIEQGVRAGERVVTDGQFLLGPTSRIQIKTAKDSTQDPTKGDASKEEGGKRRKETVS
jgi:multidrug efflux system membrane fusion protein